MTSAALSPPTCLLCLQTPTGASLSTLMPPLKHLLEGMMGQTELLKQVVAAVQDTERGKHAPMTALLLEEQDRAQRQRQPAEDLDRSRTEVGLLRLAWALLSVGH